MSYPYFDRQGGRAPWLAGAGLR